MKFVKQDALQNYLVPYHKIISGELSNHNDHTIQMRSMTLFILF